MWRPGAADAAAAGLAALLQENERPAGCAVGTGVAGVAGAAGAKWPGKAGEAPQRARSASGAFAREFGTVVDGSQAPGGLAVEGAARPGGTRRSPCRHLGFDQRRKRPADASVYIDEEFRVEHQHGRPAHRSAAGAPAPSSASATTPPSDVVVGNTSEATRAPGSPSGGRTSQQLSAGVNCPDEDVDEDADMEDKENEPRNSEGTARAAVLEHHRALREITLGLPPGDEDDPFTDADSSSGESDFQSENLAEQLAERVRLNADGLYDFEVYVDP